MVYLRDFLSLLGKRAIGAVLVSLGTITIIFFISHALSPNPAALWAGPRATHSTIQAVAARYHLNDPLLVQFYFFLKDLLTGNLGLDPLSGQTIVSEIAATLPNTVELVLMALVIVIATGVGLGYLAAMRFSTKIDSVIRTVYILAWSTPTYLGAIAALLLFSTYLHIFPSGGLYDLSISPPQPVTGIFLLDSVIALNGPAFVSAIEHLILPALVLSFLNFGLIARATRSSILSVRWSTHVKSARAKGLQEGEVRRRHILRNALIDATSLSALMFGWILTETVVVEEIFAWPGIGDFAYRSILSVDYPALVPIVVVFTIGVIIANFVADVAYSLLDPRIAMGGGTGAVG
jgi:ABC-type dipeptide/oligopeptide/nickel transport system permease component